MAKFTLPKNLDEVQEGSIVPEGWYTMRISGEPVAKPNKAKSEGGDDADGAGDNIIIDLRVESSDPALNGRSFRKYLPLPKPGDSESLNAYSGQSTEDWKLQNIADWAKAFGGEIGVDDISLEAGMSAQVYVKVTDFNGEQRSDIDFNSKPKAL